MKVTSERQENCIVQLSISLDEGQERDYLRRAARALSRNYRLPGFRPGKAPYNVVVRRLGIEAVQAQVIEQFGDGIFEEGLKESGLEPVDQASLEDVTWDPLTLHLKVPVGPEVYLGAYRDLRIPWEAPQISDEDVNQELLRLQKEQKEWRPDDRPAELGDQVVLDITAEVEGDIVLENKEREMVLNAESPYPIPGFAEAVVGMVPDETREFGLTYPEDHYNAEIAGKEGRFQVKLHEIRVEVLPLLDDEFAMLVGDYEDLEDLKAKLRESLLEEAERKAEEEYQGRIWEELFELTSVEYPQVYVEREIEGLKGQLEGQLERQGMDLNSYFQLTNTTEEAWAVQVRPQAEERLKRNLILAQVIEQENLQAETEEIETEIAELTESLGDQAEQMRELFSSPAGRMRIAESLMIEKAMDKLKAIARGQESAEEAAAPPETAALADAEKPAEAEVETVAAAEAEVEEKGPTEAAESKGPAAEAETERVEPTEAEEASAEVEGSSEDGKESAETEEALAEVEGVAMEAEQASSEATTEELAEAVEEPAETEEPPVDAEGARAEAETEDSSSQEIDEGSSETSTSQ